MRNKEEMMRKPSANDDEDPFGDDDEDPFGDDDVFKTSGNNDT